MHMIFRIVALVLAAVPATSWSQAHEQQFGAYTVRSSTVGASTLSPRSAREHGFERSPTRAVLNVTVLKGRQSVPAQVDVTARDLTGRERRIGMRETRTRHHVSYTGSYDVVHGEVLDFTVRATPRGSGKALTMTYRDRMRGAGGLLQTAAR